MECQTEGIYASAYLETCSGLTLPPKIQSGDLWLSEAAIPNSHENFDFLLNSSDHNLCDKAHLRHDDEEYEWVSAELDVNAQLPEPPRKRRKISSQENEEENSGIPEAVEGEPDILHLSVDEQVLSPQKCPTPCALPEPLDFQLRRAPTPRAPEGSVPCSQNSGEPTLVVYLAQKGHPVRLEPITEDGQMDKQPAIAGSEVAAGFQAIALPHPDTALLSIEGTGEDFGLINSDKQFHRDDARCPNPPSPERNTPCHKQSSVQPFREEILSSRGQNLAQLSLVENAPGHNPISLSCGQHKTFVSAPRSESLPLSILLLLLDPPQHSTIKNWLANHLTSLDITTSNLPHEIPTQLRDLFAQLQTKLNSDNLFLKSALTWLIEKMSASYGVYENAPYFVPLNGQSYSAEIVNAIMADQKTIDQATINYQRHQILTMEQDIHLHKGKIQSLEGEVKALRQLIQNMNNSDNNMYFRCVINITPGNPCLAVNQHFLYGNGFNRRLREKCITCKRNNTDVKTRSYISQAEAAALGGVNRRAQGVQHGLGNDPANGHAQGHDHQQENDTPHRRLAQCIDTSRCQESQYRGSSRLPGLTQSEAQEPGNGLDIRHGGQLFQPQHSLQGSPCFNQSDHTQQTSAIRKFDTILRGSSQDYVAQPMIRSASDPTPGFIQPTNAATRATSYPRDTIPADSRSLRSNQKLQPKRAACQVIDASKRVASHLSETHPHKRAKKSPPISVKDKSSPEVKNFAPIPVATIETLQRQLPSIHRPWMDANYKTSAKPVKLGSSSVKAIDLTGSDDENLKQHHSTVVHTGDVTIPSDSLSSVTSLGGCHLIIGDCGSKKPAAVTEDAQCAVATTANNGAAVAMTLDEELFGNDDEDAPFEMDDNIDTDAQSNFCVDVSSGGATTATSLGCLRGPSVEHEAFDEELDFDEDFSAAFDEAEKESATLRS